MTAATASNHGYHADQAGNPALDRLWQRYLAGRGQVERNELLMHYITLVKRVVNRLFTSCRPWHDQEDLISCGVIGLMDALDRYDPDKGGRFETYAQVRIKGEIIDYMRRQDWAPPQLRIRIRRIQAAFHELGLDSEHSTHDQLVADHLGISLDELNHTLAEAHFLNLVHLEDLLQDSPDSDLSLAGTDQVDRQVEAEEMRACLAREIEQLPERDQLVISLYYQDELTLKEIGRVLGLTESRVSQIHSSILLRLRCHLENRAVPQTGGRRARR